MKDSSLDQLGQQARQLEAHQHSLHLRLKEKGFYRILEELISADQWCGGGMFGRIEGSCAVGIWERVDQGAYDKMLDNLNQLDALGITIQVEKRQTAHIEIPCYDVRVRIDLSQDSLMDNLREALISRRSDDLDEHNPWAKAISLKKARHHYDRASELKKQPENPLRNARIKNHNRLSCNWNAPISRGPDMLYDIDRLFDGLMPLGQAR